MRVAILQHEPNEWVGSMQAWFEDRSYSLHTCMIYLGDLLPKVDDFDWLIIMGGGMSVYQEEKYPWLVAEKQLIRDAITEGKKVLGICLGGQLIASAMGAEVYSNDQQEIGWHEVIKTNPIATWCPDAFKPLSWHGDRFDLPDGATGFAASKVTPNQGFCLSDKVWALQFHLEAIANSVPDFYAVTGTMPEGDYVQTIERMIEDNYVAESQRVMHALLDVMDAA